MSDEDGERQLINHSAPTYRPTKRSPTETAEHNCPSAQTVATKEETHVLGTRRLLALYVWVT